MEEFGLAALHLWHLRGEKGDYGRIGDYRDQDLCGFLTKVLVLIVILVRTMASW